MSDREAGTHLGRHRQVWQQKPTLRRLYQEEFFARLLDNRRPGGITVEIGAGPGLLKEMAPEVITTDVVFCPWLDAVADAQRLPFESGSVMNIVGLDVLHHLETPLDMLHEANRVLLPGGRCVLVEPWITPFSYLIYRYLHQEDCDLSARPLEDPALRYIGNKKPFDSNQATPYLLFGRGYLSVTRAALSDFDVVKIEPFCLLGYLLSFGFKPVNLLPSPLYPVVMTLERWTLHLWRRVAALRALIVLEKRKG